MNNQRALSLYKEAVLENAPPLKVVHLLYDGAIRFLRQAVEMQPSKDRGPFNEKVHRADAIVCELRQSLDAERAPDLAAHLTSLYLFAEECMRTAILEADPARLAPAIDVLETLADGWKRLEGDLAPAR